MEKKTEFEEMAEEQERIEPEKEPEAEAEADNPAEAPEQQPAETHAAEETPEQGGEEGHQPNAPEPQPQTAEPQPKPARMFTQEQVNELVGKARSEGRERGYKQAMDEMLRKYDVDSADELDGIFADGSRFGEMRARNDDAESRYRNAMAELALTKKGILPARQSDVRAILAANGLDITEDNIASLLETHPEWIEAKKEEAVATGVANPAPIPQPKPAMAEQGQGSKPLGLEPNPTKPNGEEDEEERVMKNLFRL